MLSRWFFGDGPRAPRVGTTFDSGTWRAIWTLTGAGGRGVVGQPWERHEGQWCVLGRARSDETRSESKDRCRVKGLLTVSISIPPAFGLYGGKTYRSVWVRHGNLTNGCTLVGSVQGLCHQNRASNSKIAFVSDQGRTSKIRGSSDTLNHRR